MLADVVAAEGERGDDAEVPAAAAQRPEQVGVVVGAGGDEGAVGEHDIGREQVVDREPEAAGQVADAAAERQAGHAGCGDEPGRGGHAEGGGGVVDIAPGAAGVDADGAGRRVDGGAAQLRQVDDQGAVGNSESGGAVAAAANGDLGAVASGEADAGDDVGGVAAARDRGRMLVDHGVVDGTRPVVVRISGDDQVTADGGGIMLAADTSFVLHDDPAVPNLARQIVRQRLGIGNGEQPVE